MHNNMSISVTSMHVPLRYIHTYIPSRTRRLRQGAIITTGRTTGPTETRVNP